MQKCCRVKEQAPTLSFFGFLNQCSRNRDLDERGLVVTEAETADIATKSLSERDPTR
jgi:hypothetical protein